MQRPIEIHFPKELCSDTIVSNTLPRGHKYTLPFTKLTITQCDFCIYSRQFIDGKDYLMELWSFDILKNGDLTLLISRPLVFISLFLEGGITIKLPEDGFIYSPAKTYSLFYLAEGKLLITLSKGEYTMLFFVPPNHYIESIAAEHPVVNAILNKSFAGNKSGAMAPHFKIPPGIWRIVKRLQRTDKKDTALDIAIRRYMLEIIGLYNEQLKKQEVKAGVYERTKDKAIAAREYILANLGDINLGGLNEIAFHFHVSTKPLTREFKLLTGKTIPVFINDERLAFAKELLSKKELRVFEIALIAGYPDTSNFIRKFKKKYGYTPGKQKNPEDK